VSWRYEGWYDLHGRVGPGALLRVLLLRMPQCPLYPAIRGLRCKGTVSWRCEGCSDLQGRVGPGPLLRVLLLLMPQCRPCPAGAQHGHAGGWMCSQGLSHLEQLGVLCLFVLVITQHHDITRTLQLHTLNFPLPL
jgi:hypothetical protein